MSRRKDGKQVSINVDLNGNNNLYVQWKIEFLDKSGQKTDSMVKEQTFYLNEVTLEELYNLRVSGIPGFVLKNNGAYYYTGIPKDLSLVSGNIVIKHLCGSGCKRLSAAANCDGGCVKVRDLSFEYYKRRYCDEIKAFRRSKRIEKYDFILSGFESFNTLQDAMVVMECKNYIIMK